MYRIGIDLGGINIAAGLVTEDGRLVAKKSVPTVQPGDTAESITERMCGLVLDILSENNVGEDNVRSIGIGCPGAVDAENGIIVLTPNLPYKNFDVRKVFGKKMNIPVYLENDANCAVLGEVVSGAAKNYKTAIAVTLGTGVGGGIIIDGKIYNGFNCAAGELGHMITHRNGRQCNCGRKGCFEAYASATALIKDTKEAALKNPDSMLNELCAGDIDKINGKTAFDGKRAGDKVATQVVENYIEELGEGIINYINIFQPEIILIGGGISNEGEYLLEPLREYVFRYSYGSNMLPRTKIERAALKNDAGIIGAAML
ncbi:MAG: ROK family protein [Clostridia bacterium]|nr:ROK family protein [Clostridia bacterium]